MSTPIMCELTPEAIKAGREGLLPGLWALAQHRDPTDSGYRLTFDPSGETLRRIAAVIDAERQCCRWLRFQLDVPPGGEPMVLTVSGPDGARDFLAALFNP